MCFVTEPPEFVKQRSLIRAAEFFPVIGYPD